jgi:hypothetical protein
MTNDVGWSFVEAIIIAGVVMITHCYYGYTASGRRRRVCRPIDALLADLDGDRSAVRGAGALWRQPELRAHGVAAMTTPVKENPPRIPPYKTAGVVMLVVLAVVNALVYLQFRR